MKTFADIDVFDIQIDTEDPEEFIQTVCNIAPTFGGINLEDIKAPECFEIERRISESTNIPVMHDDQRKVVLNSVEQNISKIKVSAVYQQSHVQLC